MGTHYERIVNASRDFITLVDRDYRYVFANQAYCHEIGKKREAILGKTVAELWGPSRFEDRLKKCIDSALGGQEVHDIDRFVFGEGYKYIHVSYYPYGDHEGITHVMIYSHDITAIKGLESRLLDFEFKDPTTGLFNRKSFDIVFDMELEKARRNPAELRGLIFLRIRNHDEINLQYGHRIGDLIMESTGLRMRDLLRAADYVFRFEGTEFCGILTTIRRQTDLATVAQKLWEGVVAPYPNQETIISPECNIGISLFPLDGDCPQDLVKAALSAVNEAQNRNLPFVIFDQDLHERSLRKMKIKANIRSSLVNKQFTLRYQPIVDHRGMVAGAEVLIRWLHPELGWIGPSTFIPLAEEAGDILMLGRWVLYRLCEQIQAWEADLGETYFSYNLSAREFESPGLVGEILAVTESYPAVARSRIRLEITETRSMMDIEATIGKIQALRDQGFKVLLDDFGAGYSSLAYLRRIPADVVKIDKSFVDPIEGSLEDRDFLFSMIDLVRSLKKEVILEGVEHPGQWEILKDREDVRFQGYYFSPPVEGSVLVEGLRKGTSLPHP